MPKSSTNSTGGSSSIVVLQQRGASVHAILAKLESGQLAVRETQTLSATDSAGLTALLRRLKPSRVVHLIAPELTIWRSLDAPPPVAASPDELAQAMDLMSEGAMPTSLARHRRGAGVLSTSSGPAMLACGWPTDAVLPTIDAGLGIDEQCVPEVLGLWACAKLCGREPGILLSADRPAGAITLIAAASEKPALFVRVVREDGTEYEPWSQAVRQSVEELCAQCQLSMPALPSLRDERSVVWPSTSGTATRVSGASIDDPRWLAEWGALVGAARLALMPTVLEAGLLSMGVDEPQLHEPLLDRAISWLASPARVAVAATVCLVLLAGAIFAAPYARLAILKSKTSGATQAASEYQKAADQNDWYQVLREKRWPMTALLAEITSSAPEGVMIDDVSIEPGQGVRLSGTAPTAEAVSDWREALNKNPSFKDAKVPSVESAVSPVKFRLELSVAAPLLAAGDLKGLPERTIAAPTVTPSTDGKPITSAAPAPASKPEATTARPTNTTRTNRGTRTNTTTPASTESGTTSTKPYEPPAPITDEQIAALDRMQLTLERAKRQGGSVRAGVDEEIKNRLRNEVEKIDVRLKQESGQ